MKQASVSVSVAETVPLPKTLFAQLPPLADAHRPKAIPRAALVASAQGR
jgi:hypothetical protein